MLVDTAWVQANTTGENVRLLDIGGNPDAYNEGHLPGAVFLPLGNLTNPEDSTGSNPDAGPTLHRDEQPGR
ncbi:MAG: rhodanese-like domain-containing protein [Caldilineaceae bacterium]